MKGLKKCIGLLILCITFLLSLNLYSNANASDSIILNNRQYISSISFNTYIPPNTFTNQPISNFVYSPLYNITIDTNSTMRASSLNVTTANDITVSKDEKFDITIYMYMLTDSYYGTGSDLIITPICPAFSGMAIIDKCDIEYHDYNYNPIRFDQVNPQGGNVGDYTVESRVNAYYAMTIEGHFTTGSTGNTLPLSGPFLTVNNPSLQTNIKFILGFSSLRTYTIKNNNAAQDEAAEKELEDRDNLETQSTTTDNQADNASNAAETTGTTLFGAFSQLFTALTNVNGNSCTLPNMQVYSLNLGRMNLCTYTIPSQITALVSIGMVFIIVPLGIHLVKRMINLYKEITG